MSFRLAFAAAAAVALSACAASSATVVSSSGGPTISQAQAVPYNGPRQRVAVSDFEFRAGQGSGEIGDGMSDMLTDALFNSGRFVVLERERIDEVMDEQDLASSSRFRKETAAPIGEMEGAQLLIRGSVTQFEPDCRGGSVILVSGREACMAINLRVVDARTGRVVNATTVEGTSGTNGVGFVYARSDLPIGLGAYRKTPMEQAMRNCIEAAVQHIVSTKL